MIRGISFLTLRNRVPATMESPGLSRTERLILMIALVFIIVIAIQATSYIVSLILMAAIITMLGTPALVWLKERGLSNSGAVGIVTLFAVVIIGAFLIFANLSLQMLINDIPLFQQELALRIAELSTLLQPLGITLSKNMLYSLDFNQIFSMGIAGAQSFSEGLMFLFFVAVTTVFMMLEVSAVSARLDQRFGKDSHTMKQLSRMTGYIIDFIVVRTETNFIHGILFGGFLWVMGVHAALLWGMLTFLLGYIPYFGLLLAAIPAVFFAWIQFGIPGAVTVIVVICILNLIVENPVYSYLTARKYEMPALLVIISVIFWGWLLGLVGMLFAIPFTLMVLLVCQLSEDLRWINVMLGVSHLFEEVGVKPVTVEE